MSLPPRRKLAAIAGGLAGGLVAIAMLARLYEGVTRVAFGVLVLAVFGLVSALLAVCSWAAIQFNRERPQGRRHSRKARIGMFVVVFGFDAMLIAVLAPFLLPLWRMYVTPLIDAVF